MAYSEWMGKNLMSLIFVSASFLPFFPFHHVTHFLKSILVDMSGGKGNEYCISSMNETQLGKLHDHHQPAIKEFGVLMGLLSDCLNFFVTPSGVKLETAPHFKTSDKIIFRFFAHQLSFTLFMLPSREEWRGSFILKEGIHFTVIVILWQLLLITVVV